MSTFKSSHGTSPPQFDNVATFTEASYTAESSHSGASILSIPPPLSQQTSVVMPPIPIHKVIVTNNTVPPPLIPVTSYTLTTGPVNHQSSMMLSVPDVKSLYTSSTDQFTHYDLFLTPVTGYHSSAQQFATVLAVCLNYQLFKVTW